MNYHADYTRSAELELLDLTTGTAVDAAAEGMAGPVGWAKLGIDGAAFAGRALHTFVCRSALKRRTKRAEAAQSGARMVPSWPHPGNWWCGRGDLNPHDLLGSADFHTTSAFAASLGEFVVWTIPSPFPLRGSGAARLVSTPSRKHSGLARDCHSRFPRLWAVLLRRFPWRALNFLKSAVSADFTTPAQNW